MNTYYSEQNDNLPRFSIEESEIDVFDRPYLNYLQAVIEPISTRLWADFCKVEEDFLISLVEKYKIPIIKGNPDKIQPLEILNTAIQKTNQDIARDLLAKWRQR
jgi:hypothetical protein